MLLALSTEALVDLAIEGTPDSFRLVGFWYRAFGELIHIAVRPGVVWRVSQSPTATRGEGMPDHSYWTLLSTSGDELEIGLPLLDAVDSERQIDLRYRTLSGQILLDIDAQGYLHGDDVQRLDAPRGRLEPLTNASPAGLVIRGDFGHYVMSLLAIDSWLPIIARADGVTVRGRTDARLQIRLARLGGLRLLRGRLTSSHSAARSVVVIYPPFQPHMYLWLVCAVTSLTTFPIAVPPVVAPHFTVPHMGFGVDEGWMLLHDPVGDRWSTAILLGSVPVDFLIALASRPWDARDEVRTVSIIHDDREYMSQIAEDLANSKELVAESSDLFVRKDGAPIRIRLRECRLKHPPELERAITLSLLDAGGPTKDIWQTQIDNSLPPIPYVEELCAGSVGLLVNLHRGRLPSRMVPNYFDYRSVVEGEYWAIPWEQDDMSRTEFIVGAARRTAAEYLANRALYEALNFTPSVQDTDLTPDELAAVDLTQVTKAWLQRGFSGTVDSAREFAAVRGALEAGAISARDAFEQIARTMYACQGSWRREGQLSYANPFVICWATGRDTYDPLLTLNMAFWLLYAGTMSGHKPGIFVPTLTDSNPVDQCRAVLAQLRHAFHEAGPTDAGKIYNLRRSLGSIVANALEPGMVQALEWLGADRIVAFSDVPIDFLDVDGTFAGLTYPLSRLPSSAMAFLTVGRAVAASARVRRSAGTSVVLRSRRATDPQTEWALDVANAVEPDLRRSGLRPRTPDLRPENKAEVLVTASTADVVIFLGHAHASEHWAGLDFGDTAVTVEDIAATSWNGCFVILVGCETAASDTSSGDFAYEFLVRGARGVIGTSAKVSVGVASEFFAFLFASLSNGAPIDYAFYIARLRTVFYEYLASTMPAQQASERLVEAESRGIEWDFLSLAEYFGANTETVLKAAMYSLTFSSLGGAGERLF